MKARELFDWALRLGLGGLFIVAGVLKLRDPTEFAIEVTNYRLFPLLAPWLAVTLPPVEIVLGCALVFLPRDWRRASALAMAALLVAFTVAVTQAVGRGINVDCGCFGGGSGPVTWLTVARDLALLAAACAAWWLNRTPAPAK
jgi:uncharacterized membrane protein YphA (DoxX/SURF4 family)